MLKGQCHCGAVTYRCDGDILFQVNCHCVDCQRISGAAVSTYIGVLEDTLIVSGHLNFYEYKGGSGKLTNHQFCKECGSQVLHASPGIASGVVMIKVGTLKDQTNVKPAFDIFIEDKADFVLLNDYTAKFKKGIPVEPDIN